MKLSKVFLCSLVLTILLPICTFATTWFPQEFTCPLDNEKNTFLVVGSWGSYIYSWPSKYQWLFFPQTDSPTFYTCRKCHLSTYMWDFDKLPKEKFASLRLALADVKLSKQFKDSEYTKLPITERLEIMEKVYTVLGKDDEWWESFYRVKGYHYGKAGDETKAAEARRKSLAILQKEIGNEKSATPKKLILYISGSMKHFLGDDKGAVADLTKAQATKYKNATESAKEQEDGESGLNERLKDFIDRINSEKEKPRLFDKYRTDEH